MPPKKKGRGGKSKSTSTRAAAAAAAAAVAAPATTTTGGGPQPLALHWFYEHLLSLDEDLDPSIIEKLGELAARRSAGGRPPAPLAARIYLRALRPPAPNARRASPADAEDTLLAVGLLARLAGGGLAGEFPGGAAAARGVRPPPALADELLVFHAARRLAARAERELRAPAPADVARELERLAAEAGLEAALPGAALQAKCVCFIWGIGVGVVGT